MPKLSEPNEEIQMDFEGPIPYKTLKIPSRRNIQ